MTYYHDLSPYEYHPARLSANPENALNAGWLDAIHDYSHGDVPKVFVDKLWEFCCTVVLPMRGFHYCELCEPLSSYEEQLKKQTFQRGTKTLKLGSAQIRVFSRDGKIYAAPNLIYHYVVDHRYHPPEEFIQAVLEGAQPGTSEYQELLEKYDLDIDPEYGVSKAEMQEMRNYIEERRRRARERRRAKKKG